MKKTRHDFAHLYVMSPLIPASLSVASTFITSVGTLVFSEIEVLYEEY